ncbi:MAG: ComEC/Rec2 family competence protein [Clostridiales bacterium]|nr:ComEC/Rec2 family competence protein [Clostridiales bacterium]
MLVFAASGLALGILTYECISLVTALAAAALGLTAGVLLLIIKREAAGMWLMIAAAVFLFGRGYAKYSADPANRGLYDFTDSHCVITARVCELPEKYEDMYRYVVQAKEIRYDNKIHNVNERVIITSPNRYEFNDTAEFTARLKEIAGSMNEYGFDAARYYKSKGIYFRAYSVSDTLSDKRLKSYSIFTAANKLRYAVSGLIDRYFSGDKNAVLKAVLIGDLSGFSEEYEDVLLKTGLRRYFYQAYIHVMLIMLFIGALSAVVPKKIRVYLLCALLLIYCCSSCGSPVAVKAVLIAGGVVLSKRFLGYVHKPSVIALTVIIMLAMRPMLAFNGGFVMGVGGTILVFMFGNWMNDKLYFIESRIVRRYTAVSLICTVGMLGIGACFWGGIGIYSIALGLWCMGLTVLIIILAIPMLLMLAVFGSAPIFSYAAACPVYIYLKLPYIAQNMKLAHINLPSPSYGVIAINILLIAAFYRHIRKKTAKIFLAAAVVVVILMLPGQIMRTHRAELTFVNVGQGDGALISIPYRTNIIIDGGGGGEYSDYDPGEKVFVPYLTSHGKTKIEAAFISHFHRDHVQGVIRAVENLKVLRVFAPVCSDDNELKRELEDAAQKSGTQIYYIDSDTRISFKSGLELEVFVPDERTRLSEDENDTSLMINVKYGKFNTLFTGDMTKFSQQSMVLGGRVEECEVLKVPHHGSGGSAYAKFFEAASPEAAVISLGENNMYGFPHEKMLDILAGTQIFRTDENGDIKVIAEKSGEYEIKTYK